MRTYYLAGSALIGLFVTVAVQAQPAVPAALKAERITVPEVEVRSGPSAQFPATGKLQQGVTVQVSGTSNGDWLEIVPPSGSFSWIEDKVVESQDDKNNGKRTLIVKGGDVPIRTGRAGSQAPLDVSRYKVPAGTQVYARGDKVLYQNASWWPIDPVPGEVRYIPNDAILPPATQTTAQSAAAQTPAPNPSNSLSGVPDPPLWTQAELAVKDGRLDDAEQLLKQLCQQARNSNDTDLCNRCQTRIYEIRQMRRNPAMLTSRAGNSTFTPPDRNLPPTPPLPKTGTPVRTPAANVNSQQESSAGWLRRSGLQIDGKPTYALENREGSLRLYVTAEPGVDLEPYVNKIVELHGVVRVRGDVRGGNHMTVAGVVLLK